MTTSLANEVSMDTAIAIAALTLIPFLIALLWLFFLAALVMGAIWVVFIVGRLFFSLFNSWV